MTASEVINNLSNVGKYTSLMSKFPQRRFFVFWFTLLFIFFVITLISYYWYHRFSDKKFPKLKILKVLSISFFCLIIGTELFSALIVFNVKKANIEVEQVEQFEKQSPYVIEVSFNKNTAYNYLLFSDNQRLSQFIPESENNQPSGTIIKGNLTLEKEFIKGFVPNSRIYLVETVDKYKLFNAKPKNLLQDMKENKNDTCLKVMTTKDYLGNKKQIKRKMQNLARFNCISKEELAKHVKQDFVIEEN